MKKVYFTTTGCKSSQADLGNFGQSFEHLGYQPTFILKEANVVVFSSCGYTEQAYRKVVESCTSLSEDMNLDGTFIVTGCAVEIFKSKGFTLLNPHF